MDHVADAEDGQGGAASLWVIIACGRRSHCFELDGFNRHGVGIGSSPDADLRIEGPHSAPMECNLERDGDDIWLIPGWPTNFIRVDSVVVERSVKLWRRCTLEIEGITLEVRIREEPPTSPEIELPIPQSVMRRECREPSFVAERISVREIIAIESPGDDSLRDRGHSSIDGRSPATTQVALSSRESVDARSSGSRRRRIDVMDGPPSSTAPTAISVRQSARDSVRSLERLGILAQRRPWTVAMGALLGASVIAAVMHLGSEVVRVLHEGTVRPGPVEAAAPLSSLTPFCPEPRTPHSFSSGRLGHNRLACERIEDLLSNVRLEAPRGLMHLDTRLSTGHAHPSAPVPTPLASGTGDR